MILVASCGLKATTHSCQKCKRCWLCRYILREDSDQQARHPSGSTTEELRSNTYFAIAGVLVALAGRVQQHPTWASVTGGAV